MPKYNDAGIGGSDGYVVIDDPGLPGGRAEFDTYQCCHCSSHFRREVAKGPAALCRLCMRPVCDREICRTKCVPFEAQMEAAEGSRSEYHGVDLSRGVFL